MIKMLKRFIQVFIDMDDVPGWVYIVTVVVMTSVMWLLVTSNR